MGEGLLFPSRVRSLRISSRSGEDDLFMVYERLDSSLLLRRFQLELERVGIAELIHVENRRGYGKFPVFAQIGILYMPERLFRHEPGRTSSS